MLCAGAYICIIAGLDLLMNSWRQMEDDVEDCIIKIRKVIDALNSITLSNMYRSIYKSIYYSYLTWISSEDIYCFPCRRDIGKAMKSHGVRRVEYGG